MLNFQFFLPEYKSKYLFMVNVFLFGNWQNSVDGTEQIFFCIINPPKERRRRRQRKCLVRRSNGQRTHWKIRKLRFFFPTKGTPHIIPRKKGKLLNFLFTALFSHTLKFPLEREKNSLWATSPPKKYLRSQTQHPLFSPIFSAD